MVPITQWVLLTVRSAGLHGDLLGETTESGTCWESLIRACATVWSRSARWTPRNRRMGMVEGGRRPDRGSTVRSPSSHRPKIHTRQTLSALSCHQCDRNDIFQQLPSSLTASTLSFKHLQLRSYAVWVKAHMRLRNTYFSRKYISTRFCLS